MTVFFVPDASISPGREGGQRPRHSDPLGAGQTLCVQRTDWTSDYSHSLLLNSFGQFKFRWSARRMTCRCVDVTSLRCSFAHRMFVVSKRYCGLSHWELHCLTEFRTLEGNVWFFVMLFDQEGPRTQLASPVTASQHAYVSRVVMRNGVLLSLRSRLCVWLWMSRHAFVFFVLCSHCSVFDSAWARNESKILRLKQCIDSGKGT